jgi:hypothetical protein
MLPGLAAACSMRFSSFRAAILAGLSAGALLLGSCGETQQPTAAKPPATPAAQARYECPMGCAGSQSAKPGKCPTCEMELVKKS